MTPAVGDRVLLVRLRGVASPTLRAQVGKEGVVVEVIVDVFREVHRVLVAFDVSFGVIDRFWLRLEEIAPVLEEGVNG